ncbi:Tyrosine-protein phosphatase non-receptor type 23 [Clonorchis sinensis]|uniref:Tyrosine-protein phosphatase non-receptor type 23 n=1 Tax=Clonorchis sinensis TaxID=79923 RepID=A0A8T1MX17_CLOSI|nr:Tyrosine-protein phosphatase non-receptor type 23 [Clonorchis sinensis]
MDTLPRISLFGLPLKKPNGIPDLGPMRRDIERHYHTSPDLYKKELNDFLAARKTATDPSIDYAGLSKVKRYYAQLQLLKGRFQFSVDEGTAVLWSWCDAFTGGIIEAPDIRLEEASTLYNVAALHSILGVKERRPDADSMKVACTHFQCAAWALDAINERHCMVGISPDLTTELIRALSMIMTAQAQECIVEKSVLDDRPANITAKLTQYLSQTYENASTELSLPSVIANLPAKYQKDWRRRCQVKGVYYGSLAAYYSGQNEENNKMYGRAIAWFQVAVQRIGEAEKLMKDMKDLAEQPFPVSPGGPLRNNIQHVSSVFQTKLTALTKDNDFIYHETVPTADSLEQVKPACLVKGVPFDHNDPEVRGPDIFQSLVPMKTLEATSIYSERKASLLRSITSEVDAKDVALQEFMTSIDVDPESMLLPDPPLPQELYDVCARVSALEHGPERKLSEMMQSLATASIDLDSELQEARTQSDDLRVRLDAILAVKQTEELKALSVRARVISDRLLGLIGGLNQAKQSNLQQRDILGMHLPTIKRLAVPVEQIASSLPSVQALIADPALSQSLNDAQRLFGKVKEMRQQRTDFVDKLRQALHSDDATGDLLTSDMDQSTMDKLFDTRLKKHDPLIGLIRQNLAAQENIESALIDVNASFAPRAMELQQLRMKRVEEIRQLISSGQAFDDLLANCSQGLLFYEQVGARLKECVSELKDIGEKLMNEEQKLTSFSSPPIPSVTLSAGQPYTNPPFTGSGGPRLAAGGHIPTLGDYMASMRLHPAGPKFSIPPVRTWSSATDSAAPPQQQTSQPTMPQSVLPHMYPSSGLAAPGAAYPGAYTAPTYSATNPAQFSPHRPPNLAPSAIPGQTSVSTALTTPRPPVDPGVQPSTIYPAMRPTGQNPPFSYVSAPGSGLGHSLSTGLMNQPNVVPSGRIPLNAQLAQQQNMPGYGGPRFLPTQSTQMPSGLQPPPRTSALPPLFPPHAALPDRHAYPTTVPPSTVSTSIRPFPGSVQPSAHPAYFPQPSSAGLTNVPPVPGQELVRVHPPQPPALVTGAQHPARPPLVSGIPGLLPGTQPYGRPPLQTPQPLPSWQPGPTSVSQPQNTTFGFPGQTQRLPMPPQQSSTPSTFVPRGPIPSQTAYDAPVSTPLDISALQRHQPETSSNNNRSANQSVSPVTPPQTSSPEHQSAPLQPRVLTKEDFDAQRREARLRATYASQSSLNGEIADSSPSKNERVYKDQGAPATVSTLSSAYASKADAGDTSPSTMCKMLTEKSLSGRQPQPPAEPLSDPLVLNRFIAATENLLTLLDNLNEPAREISSVVSISKTVPTKLDELWSKVLNVASDYAGSSLFKGKKPTQAAALCCPMKNRHQEFVPFDVNRVVLESSKNDYINASHIDFLGSLGEWCPRYIIAQAPMTKTISDFWHMIMSQGCEVMVSLSPPKLSRPDSPFSELTYSATQGEGSFGDPSDPLHIPPHLPTNKVGSRFQVPNTSLEIRLQAIKDSGRDSSSYKSNGSMATCETTKPGSWTERVLTIQNRETQQTRSLVHLSYAGPISQSTLTNPDGTFDASVEQFCAFVNHVHSYYKQQRNLLRPIAVVCEYGAGLSGVFVTASVGLLHAEMLGRVADVCDIAGRLCQQRRGALNHPSQFVTAARLIAHAAVETVARRDVVVGPRRRASPSVVPSAFGTQLKNTERRSSNPVDSLFSNQALGVDELMSVVGRWSVGKDVVLPLSEHSSNLVPASSDQLLPSVLKEMGYARPTIDQLPGDASTTENAPEIGAVPDSHSSTTDILELKTSTNQPLVDLDALTAPTSRAKRYTRHDFQNASSMQTASQLDDIFASLDPILQNKATIDLNYTNTT